MSHRLQSISFSASPSLTLKRLTVPCWCIWTGWEGLPKRTQRKGKLFLWTEYFNILTWKDLIAWLDILRPKHRAKSHWNYFCDCLAKHLICITENCFTNGQRSVLLICLSLNKRWWISFEQGHGVEFLSQIMALQEWESQRVVTSAATKNKLMSCFLGSREQWGSIRVVKLWPQSGKSW